FNPTTAPRGTVVTITGTDFTGVTAVKFNNVAATSFTIDSSTQITTTVPDTATTGKISLTSANGTFTSANNFNVVLPPTVSTFSPLMGAVGTVVTINGTNLTG